MEDPVVSVERSLYGHPLAGLLRERQFEEILLKYVWEKFSKLGMLFRTPWKRVVLICGCGWHQMGWKETKHWSDVEVLNKEVDLGEPTSFLDLVHLGCSQRQSEISKNTVDNYTNFRGWNWKTTMLGKSVYLFVVLGYGRSCQEMCGTILWVGKQDDSTSLQSICSMHWWQSFQGRRIEICRRIVKSMLSNCSDMLFLGTHWKTSHSMVSEQNYTINHKIMDQSLWQTIVSFDILPPWHMRIQTVLPWLFDRVNLDPKIQIKYIDTKS